MTINNYVFFDGAKPLWVVVGEESELNCFFDTREFVGANGKKLKASIFEEAKARLCKNTKQNTECVLISCFPTAECDILTRECVLAALLIYENLTTEEVAKIAGYIAMFVGVNIHTENARTSILSK